MFYTELHVPDRLTNGDSHNVILPIYPMIHGKEPNDNLVPLSSTNISGDRALNVGVSAKTWRI